jgi:hypothetical protein
MKRMVALELVPAPLSDRNSVHQPLGLNALPTWLQYSGSIAALARQPYFWIKTRSLSHLLAFRLFCQSIISIFDRNLSDFPYEISEVLDFKRNIIKVL